MSVAHLTNVSPLNQLANHTVVWMEGTRVNGTDAMTLLQYRAFLPFDIANLLSLVVLLCGVLCNAHLALYIGDKFHKVCGIRMLLCNQILANLVALFAYAFVPIQALDKHLAWNSRACEAIPLIGFLATSVSLTNVAALCVSYYRGKKDGKFALSSTGASSSVVVCSWLVAVALAVPLAMALSTVEVEVDHTKAAMCAAVWKDASARDVYMNFVFVLKYAAPILVVLSTCVKTELLHFKSEKAQRWREVSGVLVDVLAATAFLLLVYFFPLSSVDKGRFLNRNAAVGNAIKIARVLEIVALANCALVPMLLTAFVDDYCRCEFAGDARHHAPKDVGRLFKVHPDEEDALEYPSNASYVTYDALIADVPEKWRPRLSRVLIV